MDDDFHRGVKLSAPKSLDFLTNLLQSIPIPLIFLTLILGPLIIFLTAQLLLIGAPKKPDDIDEGDAWMLPYQRVPWRVLGSVRMSLVVGLDNVTDFSVLCSSEQE